MVMQQNQADDGNASEPGGYSGVFMAFSPQRCVRWCDHSFFPVSRASWRVNGFVPRGNVLCNHIFDSRGKLSARLVLLPILRLKIVHIGDNGP